MPVLTRMFKYNKNTKTIYISVKSVYFQEPSKNNR